MRSSIRASRLAGWATVAFLSILIGDESWGDEPAQRPRAQQRRATMLQTDPKLAAKVTTSFKNPEELASAKGVFNLKLTTKIFDQSNAASVDPQIPSQFNLLCYNQFPVGPTIRVRRGTKFCIELTNALQKNADDVVMDEALAEAIHGLSYTNLHTHGLHVSPVGAADDVLPEYGPTDVHRFDYGDLKHHPSGTFWYHPHKHGSVAYQLSNGVAGALIVEGDPNDNIHDLDDIREIREASKNEKILVLQWYTFGTYQEGKQAIGFIDPRNSRTYNINPNNILGVPDIVAGKTLSDTNSEQPDAIMAINGQINPTIDIQPGEVQRWRVIHAGWDVQQTFQFFDETVTNATPEMRFHEIALDGMATGRITSSPLLQIAPGQRSDVLIQAPKIEPGKTKTFRLIRQDTSNPPLLGSNGGKTQQIIVATIKVSGPAKPMDLPVDTAELARCRPFQSIPDSKIVPATLLDQNGNATDTLVFHGNDPGNLDSVTGTTIAQYTLNGKTFHKWLTTPVALQLGTAQEWTLRAEAMDHPFHIHVNPFHVISYTDKNRQIIPMDVWRDTLYIPAGTSYTIRHEFRDFPGMSVIHCHILDHEDQGMMLPINLIDPKLPPKAAALAPINQPAPALSLVSPTGNKYDSSESSGQKKVLVFFRGIQCAHCTADLKALIKAARTKADPEAQIIAISSRKILDSAMALRLLGVADGDNFRLLVDETHNTFKAYGCFRDNEPQHGLFLINAAGQIISGYVGEAPYGDSDDVFAKLQLIATGEQKPLP